MELTENERLYQKYKAMLKDMKSVTNIKATWTDIHILLNMLYLKGASSEVMCDCSKWRPFVTAVLHDVYSQTKPGTVHVSLEGTPPKIHMLISGSDIAGFRSFKILDHSFEKAYGNFRARIAIEDVHFKYTDEAKTKVEFIK